MQLDEFLPIFQDVLQRDDPLTADDALADIEEWDSLAVMATIAWFDRNLGKKLTFKDFKSLETVADIAALRMRQSGLHASGAAGSVRESGRAAGMGERAAGTLRQTAWACLLRRADMESAHVAVFCGSGAAGV